MRNKSDVYFLIFIVVFSIHLFTSIIKSNATTVVVTNDTEIYQEVTIENNQTDIDDTNEEIEEEIPEVLNNDIENELSLLYDLSEEDKYLLMKVTMSEAENQGLYGKLLVMKVIMNRYDSDRFSDTIYDIVYAPGQFAGTTTSKYKNLEPDEECYEALNMILYGWNESEGALYFHNDNCESFSSWNSNFLFKYKDHSFYGEP